ncbi:MAG: 5'/3'-nucleotidase SurE [Bacteroidaceae bacterium]|nr:5'/3'-nucleotidase SurE [Bacteroidaceae bacterium]
MRPLILISNDDGYTAKGINFLIETLRPYADLYVMAPDGPRSGGSCAITSSVPLRYRTIQEDEGLTICACSGTPADCIKVALNDALTRTPDLVIGGINHGDNSAVNAHYSGTMGVCMEGAMSGFPSIAFSLDNHSSNADFTPLKSYIIDITLKVLKEGLPPFTCLNANFPNTTEFKGVKVCRMGISRWVKETNKCFHPTTKQPYLWLVGNRENLEPEATDTDIWALENNYVAVTPVTLDVTDYGLLKKLSFE